MCKETNMYNDCRSLGAIKAICTASVSKTTHLITFKWLLAPTLKSLFTLEIFCIFYAEQFFHIL